MSLLLEKGNYSAATGIWSPTPSAGISGTHPALNVPPFSPPDAGDGTPLWGGGLYSQFYPFDEHGDLPFSIFASASAGTIILVTRRQHGGSYGADAFFTQGYGAYNSFYTSDIVGGDPAKLTFEFQVTNVLDAAVLNNTFVMTQFTWNGSIIRARVNNGAFQSHAAPPIPAFDMTGPVGFGYTTDVGIQFGIRLAAISPLVLPDGTLDNFYTWAVGKGYLL